MTYKEAQKQSPIGVAVLGNIAMKDIVWPKDEPTPYWWITKHYKPVSPDVMERFKASDEWEPLEELDWVMRLPKTGE